MTILENIEKVERIMLTVGPHFQLKNVILTGVKGRDNVKLNPIYKRTYRSQKYSNMSELDSVTIKTNDYIALSYTNFQNQKPINEEVFVSYPHITDLRNFLLECINSFNTEDMYGTRDVNVKYKELCISSAQFAGGKTVAAIPYKIKRDENIFINGCLLFLNSDEIFVEVDLGNLITMYEMLSSFDLYSNSNTLLLQAMIFDMSNNSNGMSNNTMTMNNSSQPIKPTNNRSIFNRTDNSTNNSFRRPSSPIIPNRPVEKEVVNNTIKPVNMEDLDREINNNTSSNNTLSFDNIMSNAESIEVPTDDGDIEF